MRAIPALVSLCGFLVSIVAAPAAHYVVTSTSVFEQGNLSLILQQASTTPGPHTISFDPAILPATITLSSFGRTVIDYDLTMTGPGADQVTIDFGGFSPGFEVAAGRTVVFSGIKFTNARIAGSQGASGSFVAPPTGGGPARGGAILNSGNLTVTNCVFEACKAIGGDGGSGAQFTNQGGQTGGSGRGGAIFSNGGSLTVAGCLFLNNEAKGGNGGRGSTDTQGGQFSFGGGGGAAGPGQGGAIYVEAGTSTITRSTFYGQFATGGFGGAGGQFSYHNGSSLVSGTNPGGAGGNAAGSAIYAESALSVFDCTVSDGFCRAGTNGSSGFGAVTAGGVAEGGGIFGSGTITIGNTLVAENLVRDGSNPSTNSDVSGAFSSSGYNLIGALPAGVAGFTGSTELTGTVAIPLDPRLQSVPAANGFAVGSLRLLPGSPAVDKGKALNAATVDQRGLPRTVDLADADFPNAVDGDGTDIGAFESQTLPNAQPVASSGSYFTVTAGQALSGVAVLAYDEDFDPLAYTIVGTALPNGLTLNNDGSITGTTTVPGSATYQFKANDGKEDSEVATFTLLVNESPSLVVNTTADDLSNIDGVTSLREAVALAQTDGLTTPVTFDPAVFATPKSTAVPFSPISITGDVEIIGPSVGVTLTGTTLSISGGTVSLSGLTFAGLSFAMGAPYIQVTGTPTVTVTGCTFGDGQFLSSSLPLTNDGGTVTFHNCTIAGNDVTNSGSTASAIYQVAGTLLLENCTVASNVGQNAIEIFGGTFSMGNTLVAGNTLTAGGAAANQIKGSVTSLGYNLIGEAPNMTLTGTTTGNQLGVANALLDPDGLGWNGGPTKTVALMTGSPAIDKGKAQAAATTDQRGRSRPFDITGVTSATGGDGSDIGAFEVNAPEPQISVRQSFGNDTFGPELMIGDVLDFSQGFHSEVGSETVVNFEIRNKGAAPLVLNENPAIMIQGPGAGSFVVEPSAASTIAAGTSNTIQVTFWPQSAGTKTASLSIASNDLDEGSFVMHLTGSAADNYAMAPELITPKQNGGLYAMAGITLRLPEPATAGTVRLRFQLQDFPFTTYEFDLPDVVASGVHSTTLDTAANNMGPGPYFVTVDYQDALNQTGSGGVSGVRIRPASATTSVRLGVNSAAPGAGTQGLPGNATVTTFNQPAIDDLGNITYLAKWASASPKLSGTGLFVNNRCAGTVGGPTSLGGNTTFSSFTDPVIDNGQVVSIAGIKGGTPKPPAFVVVTSFTSQNPMNLSVVASLGAVAPDAAGNQSAGSPVFKTFHAVDIRDGVIGVYAQLSGGEGTAKVSSSNDTGLWLKNGNGPLRLVLREGQTVGNKTISNLLVFAPGELSGGQGRGWLTKPVGTGGAVLALATFTDKTQAVLSAEVGGVASLFSSAGALGTDGGPSIAGASFVNYGFPAANDRDTNAFAALLKIGAGGVGKADARGIFLSHPDGSYTPLARVGQPSGVDGSSFSTLRDPVLSSDDGVAFLATLKGGTVPSKSGSSIWWKPVGDSLAVLARAGNEANDIPGSQWTAFTNLAIAGGGRGPVFVASLNPKIGGVTTANDTGVWGCDFLGQPRLLFREGDMIGGRRLTGFLLLSSAKGSLGVTRSINDKNQVAWVALFSDKTSALMVTEIP